MHAMILQSAIVTCLCSAALAQPRVIITEIMYNPASTEKKGETEWIEIANVGTESIEIKDWTIRIDQKKVKWSKINCTLAPGGVAVLVNRDAVDEEKFRAAWAQQPPSGNAEAQPKYQVIPLKWGALANNSGENALQLINDKEEIVCEVKQNDQWPRVAGAGGSSIFLADATAANISDGSLWRISQEGMDGAYRSTATTVFDKPDCGSPGYVPGINGTPAATTPVTAPKPKKAKQPKKDDDAEKPQEQASGNTIDY